MDNDAITRSDVEKAYRFELFLDGQSPKIAPDVPTLELVRDRLIDQKLLLHEADTEGISEAEISTTPAQALADIRKKYSSNADFESTLHALDMNEQQVRERLRDRQRILLLIDRRLRPAARIEPPDVEAYYQKTFVPEMVRRGKGPAPPLAEVQSQIEEILTQRKINELLTAWLGNMKSSHRVTVRPVHSK